MDRAPGRIGFMSTQRRENRSQRTGCTDCARPSGELIPGLFARTNRVYASGGTAPPGFPAIYQPGDEELSLWVPVSLATNSLLSGYRIVQLVRHFRALGWPPSTAAWGSATGTNSATHGSSLPHIPSPSGYARLHPILPQIPAGRRRWAERYDGKRDLYLQHAA